MCAAFVFPLSDSHPSFSTFRSTPLPSISPRASVDYSLVPRYIPFFFWNTSVFLSYSVPPLSSRFSLSPSPRTVMIPDLSSFFCRFPARIFGDSAKNPRFGLVFTRRSAIPFFPSLLGSHEQESFGSRFFFPQLDICFERFFLRTTTKRIVPPPFFFQKMAQFPSRPCFLLHAHRAAFRPSSVFPDRVVATVHKQTFFLTGAGFLGNFSCHGWFHFLGCIHHKKFFFFFPP